MSSQPAQRPADGQDGAEYLNEVALTSVRTLRILFYLGQSRSGRTVNEICAELDMKRWAVARALKVLEMHELAEKSRIGDRRHGDLWVVGVGAVRLARAAGGPIREVAAPVMQELADNFGLTATLSAVSGHVCIALASVEPLATSTPVSYRTGYTHPLTTGAAGVAILASRPPQPHEPERVSVARKHGYAVTAGELQPDVSGVAAPIWELPGEPARYSLGLVGPTDRVADRVTELGTALIQRAERIADRLL